MRRRRYLLALALVAGAAIATTLTLGLRPGQSPRGGVSASRYSGRLYSVQDVQRAFAQFGWKLKPAPSQHEGVITLQAFWNIRHHFIPLNARGGVVEVATQRSMVGTEASLPGRHKSFANVTVLPGFGGLEIVRGALSALRWGTIAQGKPGKDLIVPGKSIGPFRLGEKRAAVERAFGPGTPERYRGFVSYFGGRVGVSYEFHGGIYNWVTGLSTRSPRYHMSSGIHVGSSAHELRKLFASCGRGMCSVLAGPWPDALATTFVLHHGRVTEISFTNA